MGRKEGGRCCSTTIPPCCTDEEIACKKSLIPDHQPANSGVDIAVSNSAPASIQIQVEPYSTTVVDPHKALC